MEEKRSGVERESLTDGPGKLTEAFEIGKAQNGENLVTSDVLWFAEGGTRADAEIKSSGRIGISRGKEEQLRFFLAGNRFVSR